MKWQCCSSCLLALAFSYCFVINVVNSYPVEIHNYSSYSIDKNVNVTAGVNQRQGRCGSSEFCWAVITYIGGKIFDYLVGWDY